MDKDTPDKLESIKAFKQTLTRGDIIHFHAIFRRLGNEFLFHELELLVTEVTEQKLEPESIPMIATEAGNLRKALPDQDDEQEKKLFQEMPEEDYDELEARDADLLEEGI
jgi:hypothetical protein